jgi:DNA-binding HxlR family transcriptional regulator
MARASTHRQWTPLARALTATADQWNLLIVLALASGPARLSRLKERLPGISTGVLEHHVQQMTAYGLVSRRRFREVPPRVEIELTDAGRELLPIAAALARWGMRHQWSAPATRGQVAADALLRQLPALLDAEAGLAEGSVEAVLTRRRQRISHWFRMADGRLQATDVARVQGGARVCVEGNDAAWVAALGPALDQSKLRISGEEQLATQIFAALARTRSAIG